MKSTLFHVPKPSALLWSILLSLPVGLHAQSVPPAPESNDKEVLILSPFSVVASPGGYRVSSATAATRTNTPLIEIPQSVAIVTSEFWDDTAATTLTDSFRYVSNAFVRNRNAGPGTLNLRGFETGNSFATEGVRLSPYKRDMAGYDRLEVVKGPPSAVQGRGGVGGLLNYILKKPVPGKFFANYSLRGIYDDNGGMGARGTVDLNLPFPGRQDLSTRVVAVMENRDDYIDMMKHTTLGLYPSFRWQISDRTELIVANEFLYTNTPSREEGHGFIVFPSDLRRHLEFDKIFGALDEITSLNIPYEFQAGGPNNEWKDTTAVSNIFLVHKFSEHIDYRQTVNLRYQGVEWVSHNIQNNISRFQNVVVNYPTRSTNRVVTLQGDLFARYDFPYITTTTLLGYQYQYDYGTSSDVVGVPVDPAYSRVDLLLASQNPGAYFGRVREIGGLRYASNNAAHSRNVGIYAQEEIGLFGDRLKLSGGLRSDKDRSKTTLKASGGTLRYSGTVLNSWRYGATFKVLPRLVAYGVVSIQNDPPFFGNEYVLTTLPAGDPRRDIILNKPRQNDLTEFGIKSDVFGGKVTATLAWWKLARTNNSFTTTFDEAFIDSQGQPGTRSITKQNFADAESSGIEIEMFGELTPRLSAVVNFVKMDTKEADTLNPGKTRPLRFAPEWSTNMFFKYSLRDSRGHGWAFKGGTNWIGPVTLQVVNAENRPLSPGGRYRLDKAQHTYDLGVAYAWSRFEMDLQVNNVGSDYMYITRSNPLRTLQFTFTAKY